MLWGMWALLACSTCLECGFVALFLFFSSCFTWSLKFWFLIFAPIVHPQYTRVGYFFLNKIFSLPIKKKKIILFCIARWQVTCGHLYLLSLGFLESCQRGSVFFFLLQLYTSSVTWYCSFLFFINKFYFLKKKKKKKRFMPKARFKYWIVGKEIWIIVGI